jgi:hypothetical protein
MYNLIVILNIMKKILRAFGLDRAKIGKNHNIPFFGNLHYKACFLMM